ncbi:glycosyltransferase [Yeosuana sp. AK3]
MILFLIFTISILGFIIIATIGFDSFLYFKNIYSRIYIGRFNDMYVWHKKINTVNQKWLNNTPTVKLTDSERYVLLDIYRGKFRKKSIQNWQEAGVLLGALEMIKHHPYNEKTIREYINKKVDVSAGKWKEIPEYYCVEKLLAKNKIGFIHNDYNKLEMDKTIDKPYFKKLDAIVTDSEECKTVLVKNFPESQHKIKIIANIVSPTLIDKLSNEPLADFPKKDTFNIISIGRLDPQKGYDFAIDALKIVKEKGYAFHWTILGEGGLKQALLEQIKANNLQNYVSFLGIKENHYPYVKKADLFMQTSRFEGKSIAIDEAKILNKPILVTNFSTVNDQITNKKTGIIVEMTPEAIAKGLIECINNTNLRLELANNLSKEALGTESEIEKIYALI